MRTLCGDSGLSSGRDLALVLLACQICQHQKAPPAAFRPRQLLFSFPRKQSSGQQGFSARPEVLKTPRQEKRASKSAEDETGEWTEGAKWGSNLISLVFVFGATVNDGGPADLHRRVQDGPVRPTPPPRPSSLWGGGRPQVQEETSVHHLLHLIKQGFIGLRSLNADQ